MPQTGIRVVCLLTCLVMHSAIIIVVAVCVFISHPVFGAYIYGGSFALSISHRWLHALLLPRHSGPMVVMGLP